MNTKSLIVAVVVGIASIYSLTLGFILMCLLTAIAFGLWISSNYVYMISPGSGAKYRLTEEEAGRVIELGNQFAKDFGTSQKWVRQGNTITWG